MRASHIKTFRGHGSFISSNLVGETHVPRNAPGTPQANARFRPARAHARSADESQESAGDCADRAGSGRSRSEAGLGQKQGGLGEREALEGENSVGRGRSKGWGRAREGLGESGVAGSERSRGPPTSKTHRWPPDGQAAHAGLCRFREGPPAPPGTNDAIRPAPPPSQKCRGRSAGTPLLHGVRITRELRRTRN
jgi:hypothetical protein